MVFWSMVVSLEHNVVWIHNPKTAGSSIAQALAGISEMDKVQNRLWLKVHETPGVEGVAHMPWWAARKILMGRCYHNHAPLYFGFVRNPWDWIHSHYMWERSPGHPRHSHASNVSFGTWLRDKFNHKTCFIDKPMRQYVQWWRLSANREFYQPSELRIYRYEDLSKEWPEIAEEINRRCNASTVPLHLDLQEKRTGDPDDYIEAYMENPDLVTYVGRLLSEDIGLFNYYHDAPCGKFQL